MTELIVDIADDGERSVLTLSGELDIDSVGELRNKAQGRIESVRCRALTIDLGGLTFIDSSGLGLLIELRSLAHSTEVAFEMVNVPSGPARVIAIAGLTETFGLPSPDGGAPAS